MGRKVLSTRLRTPAYPSLGIAPHNYYSHLADTISAQFCGTLPNVRIMEIDIDDVTEN